MKTRKPAIFAAFWFATCATLGFIGHSALPGQDKSALPDLDGDWSIVFDESTGDHFSTLTVEQMLAGNQPRGIYFNIEYRCMSMRLCRDAERAKPHGTFYVLHPDGKKGAIDLYHYDNGKKAIVRRGLYRHNKDGYLIFAMNLLGEKRPVRFGASNYKSPKEVYVMRKGLIK